MREQQWQQFLVVIGESWEFSVRKAGRAWCSWRRAVEEGWCRFIDSLSRFAQGKRVPGGDKLVV
jgi:hypothetical protein